MIIVGRDAFATCITFLAIFISPLLFTYPVYADTTAGNLVLLKRRNEEA